MKRLMSSSKTQKSPMSTSSILVTGAKTHKTAVALIPPEEIWEPIQGIRRVHDRHLRRWMPHITLIYPFRPRLAFASIAQDLASACDKVQPFRLKLARFDCFRHSRGSYTLWLVPEPAEAVIRLQETLWDVVPDCDEVRRFAHGFTPHLSVGQVTGEQQKRELMMRLEAQWQPLEFIVREVNLISRGEPPDDVFRVDRAIRLGPKVIRLASLMRV